MTHKAIALMSADASLLISEISRMKCGDEITWERMTEIVGWNIQEKNGVMQTVKNRLLRDYDIVLGTMPTVGYRLLTDPEIVEGELAKDRERRRRAAMRSKRKAAVVDLGKLTEGQRIKCLGEIAAAHVTAETSSDKSIKQMTLAMNGQTEPLALNKALDALKHNV